MNNGWNPIKIDADVELCWVSALSDEQFDHVTHTTPSENELESYRNEDQFMMTIVRSKIKGLIAEKLD